MNVSPRRIALVVLLFCAVMSSRAPAKSDARGWFCFLAFNEAEQGVEACERTRAECQRNVTKQALPKPANCFAAKEAAAFVALHADGKKETLAVPQLEACEAIRASVLGEPGISSASPCKMTP